MARKVFHCDRIDLTHWAGLLSLEDSGGYAEFSRAFG